MIALLCTRLSGTSRWLPSAETASFCGHATVEPAAPGRCESLAGGHCCGGSEPAGAVRPSVFTYAA